MSDIFNSRFCLWCFLVHLLFSQGFSNLWEPSGEDKEFQSLYFDGGIGAGSPLNSAKINSSIVRADLSHCSLEIHKEKFNWEPERKFSWIGYNLDAKTRLSFASCGPLALEMSHKS